MRLLTARTRVFAIMGDPVGHSLSPVIQNAAFGEAGVDGVYVALHCDAERMVGSQKNTVRAHNLRDVAEGLRVVGDRIVVEAGEVGRERLGRGSLRLPDILPPVVEASLGENDLPAAVGEDNPKIRMAIQHAAEYQARRRHRSLG